MVKLMNMNKVTRNCMICGKYSHLLLTDEEMTAYKEYKEKGGLIQDILPSLNNCEREFLKSGYCPKCQEMLFGNGETERIKY